MADAKKCDRCGQYYQEVEPNFLETIGMSVRSMFKNNDEQKCITVLEKFLDLCPSCSKSLKKWVKGDKTEDG